jgi:hypothetical protein
MRLASLLKETTVLTEAEAPSSTYPALSALDGLALDGRVEVSYSDIFDMTGTPYPEGVGPEFFESRRRTVGYNPGDLSPAVANLFQQWDASGRNGTITLPTLEEWAEQNNATITYGTDMFGNPMTYDNNHAIVDLMWRMTGSSWEFLGQGIVGGAAEISDWIGRRMGILDPGDPGLRDTVDPIVQFAQRVADSNYGFMDQQARDRLASAESGITSLDDIWNVVTGDSEITGEGLALMVAGELPSELTSAIAFGVGRFGFLLAGGLNTSEAMGFTGASMDARVQQLWDEGVLEGSEGLAIARSVFPNDEAAQLRFIQDRVKNETLGAIGVIAGIGDTIGDAMAWTGLGRGMADGFARRLILGAIAESGEEGMQQFLENVGIQEGTGIPQDLTAGVVNAMYQGAVVQGGVSVLGTTAQQTERSIEAIREAFAGEEDPIETLLRARNQNFDQVMSGIRETYGEDATLATVFDSVPTQDELSRGQRRQLSRTGFFTLPNGRRITRSQVEFVSDSANRRTLAILQFGQPDAETNQVELNFETIDNLELAARSLGVDVSEFDLTSRGDVTRLARAVSDEVNLQVDIDAAIQSFTPPDIPQWSNLDSTQQMQLINRGWTETPDGRFELEEVARTTIESGDPDSLPNATYFNNLRTEILGPQDVDTDGPDALTPPEVDADSDAPETPTQDPETGDREAPALPDPNVNPEQELTVDAVAEESPVLAQTEIRLPPAPSTDVARGTIRYNAMMRMANGNMDADVIDAMLNNLEETYPGIRDEILQGRDPSDFANLNPEEIQREAPARPELNLDDAQPITPPNPNGFDSTGRPRPPANTEIEIDGQNYRFLGRMWAPVKDDGSLGSTGAVPSTLQRQLSDTWISQTPELQQPETGATDSGATTPAQDPEVGRFTPPQLTPPPQTDTEFEPSQDPEFVPGDFPDPEVDDTTPTLTTPQIGPTDNGVTPPDPEADIRTREAPPRPVAPDTERDLRRPPTVPPVDAQTDIEQPTAPEVDTDSGVTPPDPEADIRTSDTPTRPTAPEPESDIRRPEQQPSPDVDSDSPTQPTAPEVDTDSEIDTDTTVDPEVTITAPPELTRPDVDTEPDVDTTTPEPEAEPEVEPEVDVDPEVDVTPDAPIDVVNPATVATVTSPAINTRTQTEPDTQRGTGRPRTRAGGMTTPPKFDFGRLKPVQVGDPEDLNKFRRVT